MMKKITIGQLCKPNIGQIKLDDDRLIDYFDIASIDNINKKITGFTTYTFVEAPSRARRMIKKDNILVSTIRPNLNAVALFDMNTQNIPVASTGFCVLDCKEDTNPRFLFYYLQSRFFVNEMVSQATGASYPAVSDKIVRSAHIPVYSYDEQVVIADMLDKVTYIIAKRKQQLAKLDELVKARFVEMFSDTRAEEPLATLCTFIDYRGKTPEKAERGLPFITAKNIKMHHMSFETKEFISKETYDKVMTRGFPKVGDVVFTTEAPLGNVCRIPYMKTEFYIGQRIITMQTKALEPVYLEYALSSDDFKRKILEKSSGSTVTGIRSKLLEQLTIPVPPIAQQQKFAAFVGQIEKIRLFIQKNIEKIETLKKALMQKYFE